jgi:hypothetical protein
MVAPGLLPNLHKRQAVSKKDPWHFPDPVNLSGSPSSRPVIDGGLLDGETAAVNPSDEFPPESLLHLHDIKTDSIDNLLACENIGTARVMYRHVKE